MARLSRVLDAIERATHDDRRDLTPELRSNIFKYLMASRARRAGRARTRGLLRRLRVATTRHVVSVGQIQRWTGGPRSVPLSG